MPSSYDVTLAGLRDLRAHTDRVVIHGAPTPRLAALLAMRRACRDWTPDSVTVRSGQRVVAWHLIDDEVSRYSVFVAASNVTLRLVAWGNGPVEALEVAHHEQSAPGHVSCWDSPHTTVRVVDPETTGILAEGCPGPLVEGSSVVVWTSELPGAHLSFPVKHALPGWVTGLSAVQTVSRLPSCRTWYRIVVQDADGHPTLTVQRQHPATTQHHNKEENQ